MQKIISFLQEQSKILGTWANTFWQVLIVVTLAKLIIAFNTYGTNDIAYFEKYLRTAKEFGGGQVFTKIWHYNHPLFFITWLYFIDFLSYITSLPFPFCFRFFDIVADISTVFLVIKLVSQIQEIKLSPIAILLLIISPASIMVSGFHGNYDPMLIFVILLAVYFATINKPAWIIGFVFGMSLNLKIVGIMLIPAFFFYLPDMTKRMQFLLFTGLTFFLGSMPYLLSADLMLVYKQLFNYNSGYGIWGISRFLSSSLPTSLDWINIFYNTKSKFFILGFIALMSFWMNKTEKKTPLFLQCGTIFFVFISLTPGFGVQYLTWLSPWLVVLGVGLSSLFCLTSGLFLFLVYTFWSQGFPWDFANSDVAGNWTGYIIYYEILCWAVVLAVAFNYLKLVISLKKTEIAKTA